VSASLPANILKIAVTKQKIAYDMPRSMIEAEKRLTTNIGYMGPSKPIPKEYRVLNVIAMASVRDDLSINASSG
jgi:hypothetical protein